MRDRIRKIIDSQHMTQQEFAETIKIAPATLSSIFTGRTAPSLKIVDAIKTRFPDISTDWLVFGKGNMLEDHDAEAGMQQGERSSSGNAFGVDFGPEGVDSSSPADTSGSVSADNVALSASHGAVVSAGSSRSKSQQVLSTSQPKFASLDLVKNTDTKERKIVEIRIFYDDQTWETFVPKK